MHEDDARLIAAEPALPGLATILEPAALQEWCGRLLSRTGARVTGARVNYLRYKRGTTMVAGLRLTGPGAPAQAFAIAHVPGSPKIDKAITAGERVGARVLADRRHGLVLGPASADRHLPGVAGTLRRRGVEPLVYKPGRRWVGLDRSVAGPDGSGALVVKAHQPERAADFAEAYRLLAARLPTAALQGVDVEAGLVRTRYVPGTPLDRVDDTADTAAHWHGVGVLLAELHRAPVPPGHAAPDRHEVLDAALRGVAAVAPELLDPARATVERVLTALAGRRRVALVHGDLSADQVVLRPEGTLALIDLDRAGVDDPLTDLASWAAAEIAAGRAPAGGPVDTGDLLGALLTGYREAGGETEETALRALTAAALLQRATEPFRTRSARWGEGMVSLLRTARDLAEQAVASDRVPGVDQPPARPPGLPTTVHDVGSRERDGGSAPVTWQVTRAWPRGEDHVLLELNDGARTMAGQWFADPAELAREAERQPAPARMADGVLVQPGGADRRLPALPGLLERGARLVSHRPGRRAVLQVDAGRHGEVEYVKVLSPAKVREAARRARLVAAASLPSAVVPPVLEADERAGLIRLGSVGDRTLHEAGADPAADAEALRRGWEAAGRAVTGLHGLSADAAPARDGLSRHGVEEELRAITSWTGPAVRFGLLDECAVGEALRAVEDQLRAEHEPVLGVLHRDLHDKQLLLREDGLVGLIDADTLAIGERALDVANLLVHLELRERQGLLGRDRAWAARLALRRTLPRDEGLWARVPAYAAAARLRLAGVYAFRPRWRQLATELIDVVLDAPVPIAAPIG